MPKRTFTETWLKSLTKKTLTERIDYTEAGRKGFMLRHWPGGERTFVVRYQRDGKTRVLTLGNYPAMSLEDAHDGHAEARRQLARGQDPIEERERKRREREAQDQRRKTVGAVTIRNVIAEWAWHYARRHRKRPREAVRLLRVNFATPLASKPAQEITKRDLVLVIDRVIARGSPVMANRLRDLIVPVFAFAAARDLIPMSPAAGLQKKPGGDEDSRERALTSDEVKVFWAALARPDTKISPAVRLGLKLILVTAQRPGEVVRARFDQIDTQERVWRIPGDIAKNEREHFVPLTDLALELIEALRGLADGRPHLLPSRHSKQLREKPMSERALPRALNNNRTGKDDHQKLFGLELFTPHDLRRTASTHMTSLGIPRLHVKKLLNHSDEDDTTGIYDRYHYWAEKQHALEVWADELRAVVAGKVRKEVPLGDDKEAVPSIEQQEAYEFCAPERS